MKEIINPKKELKSLLIDLGIGVILAVVTMMTMYKLYNVSITTQLLPYFIGGTFTFSIGIGYGIFAASRRKTKGILKRFAVLIMSIVFVPITFFLCVILIIRLIIMIKQESKIDKGE